MVLEKITPNDIEVAARHSRDALRDWVLSAPSLAAYFASAFYVDRPTAQKAAELSGAILDSLAAGQVPLTVIAGHESMTPVIFRAAIRYAATVVYEASADPITFSIEDGLQLERDTLVRLRDLYVYRNSLGLNYLPVTLESELSAWGHFVANVESGYEEEQSEYLRGLALRDGLHDAASMIEPAHTGGVTTELSHADRVFSNATYSSTISVLGVQHRWKKVGWWYFRIPKRAGRLLTRDLVEAQVWPQGPQGS